jgi:hypothetical protein
MDEDILAAAFLLDKAKTLGIVEPLYCTCCHCDLSPVLPLIGHCAVHRNAPTLT